MLIKKCTDKLHHVNSVAATCPAAAALTMPTFYNDEPLLKVQNGTVTCKDQKSSSLILGKLSLPGFPPNR